MSQRADYANSAAEESPSLWAARAALAERAVLTRHLRRVLAVPGTRLGVAGWPAAFRQRFYVNWNYWWQAHLLDCLVDAQHRAPHPGRASTINRLIRGVRMRNFGSWVNDLNDDIAWLGLALLRAHEAEDVPVRKPLTKITDQLRDEWTDHAGGGIWWRKGSDFKNVPANGPAAILFARWSDAGGERPDRQRARSMTEWMEQVLVDPETGLLWDGLYVAPDGSIRDIAKSVYTYCQGVFLGACVELAEGDTSGVWVARAERTIDAVATHLADDDVLRVSWGRGRRAVHRHPRPLPGLRRGPAAGRREPSTPRRTRPRGSCWSRPSPRGRTGRWPAAVRCSARSGPGRRRSRARSGRNWSSATCPCSCRRG